MPEVSIRKRKATLFQMNNCLILGFGRSGTSMMGGLLEMSGYYTGDNSYQPRSSNPKGFFEDARINSINERIMEPFDGLEVPSGYSRSDKTYSPFKPRRGHRWLSYLPANLIIDNIDPLIATEIQAVLNVSGAFAYKDPRFTYTLPVWTNFLGADTRFIVMFRNPALTVKSVLLECATAEYLNDFYIDEALCYQLWSNSYRYIIENHLPVLKERILFVSYEQLIEDGDIRRLSEFLNTPVSRGFIEPLLNRSKSESACPANIDELYQTLVRLSEI